jgi:hypothetical protein
MHHEDVKGAAGLSFLRPLFSGPRIAAMVVLGFASGIPYQLVYITQSAWLYEAKVPIGTIGMMSELTLAYKFKWHRQLESAMRARNTPLGFSSAQIATLALEMWRQTVKARSRVVRRSSAVAFSG